MTPPPHFWWSVSNRRRLQRRRTFWISATLGSLVIAVVPAYFLAGFGATLLGDVGMFAGAALGLAGALAVGFFGYRSVQRTATSHR